MQLVGFKSETEDILLNSDKWKLHVDELVGAETLLET